MKKIFVACLLIFILSSCQVDTDEKEMPSDIPQDIRFDGALEIKLVGISDTFDFGPLIYLAVLNRTDTEIWFPLNFQVMIYQFKPGDGWVLVENSVRYQSNNPDNGVTIAPYKDIFDAGSLSIAPDLNEADLHNTLRIIIVGYNVINGEVTPTKLGGYLDMTIDN